MTLKQTKHSLDLLTEVQAMLSDLPKGKALKAYNKLSKVKLILKKDEKRQRKHL